MSALESETEESEWAQKTLQALHERSPTSVRVTLRQMRLGRRWTIDETFQREYLLAEKMMRYPDFNEGVSARLIRKPAESPRWQPPTLSSPTSSIDDFFRVEGSHRLGLLNQGAEANYAEYPHAWLGLPREEDVERQVRKGNQTREQVSKIFEEQRAGKQGVAEKVTDILSRRTFLVEGMCSWMA